MPDVAMPRLSDSMEEGTILKWLKSDGDEVTRGEELVEIETDKANMTYEADQDGTLSIVAKEGDTLAVGETIARIGEGGGGDGGASEPQADEAPAQQEPEQDEQPQAEAAEQPAEAPTATEEPPAEPSEPEPAPAHTNGSGDGERVKASPIARRMAREMNVELSGVQGTGPGGRIVKADVEAAAKGDGQAAPAAEETGTATPAEAPAEAPAQAEPEAEKPKVPAAVVSGEKDAGRGETTTQDLTRLQQTVARRMAESKATAPEFVLNCEVDMEAAVELRKQLKVAAQDGRGTVPSFNDFVIKASALALRDFPRANGAYRDGKFELYGRVNVGVAVAGQDALVVPTVFDADRKSLGQIAGEARALAERVRAGAITPPELSSGTFTVSNLGMYGISSFVAVINPPQAAILAVGAMEPKAIVEDGEVAGAQPHDDHAGLRPPHPLRRGRGAVPRAHPRAARRAAAADALALRAEQAADRLRRAVDDAVDGRGGVVDRLVHGADHGLQRRGRGHRRDDVPDGLDDGADGPLRDARHRRGRERRDLGARRGLWLLRRRRGGRGGRRDRLRGRGRRGRRRSAPATARRHRRAGGRAAGARRGAGPDTARATRGRARDPGGRGRRQPRGACGGAAVVGARRGRERRRAARRPAPARAASRGRRRPP